MCYVNIKVESGQTHINLANKNTCDRFFLKIKHDNIY